MKGFSGSACERLDCHDACNDKGICYSMKDFAARTRLVNYLETTHFMLQYSTIVVNYFLPLLPVILLMDF